MSERRLPLTPRMEAILASADEHARRYGHARLGTEHLLLALADDPEGIAGRVLEEVASRQRIRERVDAVVTSPQYHTRSRLLVDQDGRVAVDEQGRPRQRRELRRRRDDGTFGWVPVD